jgi:ribonucleoside-diphosphate reductase alpha chain
MNKYSYDQVFNTSLDYFNGDELAAKVFVDKYALQNSNGEYLELTPTDMHHRLAKEFARIEQKYPNPMSEEEIFNLFDRFKYVIPQGSPMFGIGNDNYVQSLGNCFVINSPFDSYGGICKTDQELVQLMKRRAGVGFDVSTIRPKGLPTKNAAKTTDGIAIFLERFSNSCREVAQSGRRGAELMSISVEHPEIETFVTIKQNKNKVTGANVSVRITDKFMNAVKNDKDFTLQWPVETNEPTITKLVKAGDIWNNIVHCAWASAEPGVFFWDNVIKNSPADIYAQVDPTFKTRSSNPCQPGWATLLTKNGITTFDNVSVGDIIWSGKRWTKIINKVCTGEGDVYAFRTRAGTFYGTENHRVVSNNEKIEVKDAESIDISYCLTSDDKPDSKEIFNKNIIDGLVIGDGMVHKASNNKVVLIIGQNDNDYFDSEISSLIIKNCTGIGDTAWQVNTNIKYSELPKTYDRSVPYRYKFGSFDTRRGFLRGIYSANGSVINNRITLKTASFKMVEDIQQMLSSLGIPSYYTVNKAHEIEFHNGLYECKENYDLNIGTLYGRELFNKYIGFIHNYKNEKVKQTLDTKSKPIKSTYDIIEKEYLGKELVYDITVEADEHTYWTGGLCVSNCGEIPMGIDSCRLMVVNLLSFIKNPFKKNAVFDYKNYSEVVVKAQRLMDDLIDLEIEKINKIIAKIKSDPEPDDVKNVELKLWQQFLITCKNGRRTGLGITALGDALASLNIKYGSDDSIKETEKIYKHLAINAYKSSAIMAKERGAFPIFNSKLEKDHPFISRIINKDEELNTLYNKYGRRNIALTTTAPTGSVSTLTQTTSGIEPAYLLSYVRRKKINPLDQNAKVDFIDHLGDKWQEFQVYHHGVDMWMKETGETDIKKSPYWGATSNEIDWVASVDMQAVAQKWICHAISKTCNLPSTATEELVGQVYMRAWESGCKGFTVYRDGCRTGVLVSSEDPKNTNDRPEIIKPSAAPKRPEELPCDIKKVKIQGEQWTIFIGLLKNKPYEIFGGLSKYVDIQNKYKTGKIVKNGKVEGITTYNLIVGEDDDCMVIKDIANVFENANYGAFTRTISLSLRHGVPVQFIMEQMQKDKHSDITSFSKVIGRVLKQYISDGTISNSEKICPSCNANNSLIYQEGCLRCTSCPYSRCT